MSQMSRYIDLLNQWSQSKWVESIFKWGKPTLIYGSIFLPFSYFFSHDTRMFGSISFGLLIAIMMVRPLTEVFPEVLLFRKVLSIRRALGIAMGMTALTHGLGSYYYSLAHTWGFLVDPKMPYFYGGIAVIFSTLLLITSNNSSVALLGPKWKWLHRCVYIIFYMVCVHVAFIGYAGIDLRPLIV